MVSEKNVNNVSIKQEKLLVFSDVSSIFPSAAVPNMMNKSKMSKTSMTYEKCQKREKYENS